MKDVIDLVCLIVTIQFYQLIKQLMKDRFYFFYFSYLLITKIFFTFDRHLFLFYLELSEEVE